VSRAARPSVARDQGGAVLVMGVFMAALLVGFLYYVKGIGSAIVFRERMQDAADAAAFAGATVQARGMNLIALINVSTAGVLAVVTATRLVHAYIAPSAIALAVLQFAGQRPGLIAVRDAGAAHDTRLSRPLFGILRAGNTAANAVATAIPLAAQAHAMAAATGAYHPAVQAAFPYPAFRRLPVEDSTVDELIARSAAPAVPLAVLPFRPFSVAMGFIASNPVGVVAALKAREVMNQIDPASALFMVPQHLSDTAVLGSERLQIRVAVGGHFDFALSERGVEVATRGQNEAADDNQNGLAALASVSLAQAEYYYDGPDGRDQWLWNQRWKARLRRVRVDGPQPCSTLSIDCGALDNLFQRGLERAVVH